MATKIIVDAGHGGYDNGATYNGRKEKDDNLRLALAVGDKLERDGFDVVYTRTDDTYTSPTGKARIGNENGGDYFVSIHRNSAANPNQYNGVQTLIYNNSGIKSAMAENVNSQLEKLGFNNLGIEIRPNLAVLRRTNMPAILVEAGFINSDKDNALFDEKFDQIANAIATGIENTLSTSAVTASTSYDFPYNFQLLAGCYKSIENARQTIQALTDYGYEPSLYFDDGIYQLRVGGFDTREEAVEEMLDLRENGLDTLIVGVNPELVPVDLSNVNDSK